MAHWLHFDINAAQWIRTKTVRAGRTLEHPEFDQEPGCHAGQCEEANHAKRVRIPGQRNVDIADWQFKRPGVRLDRTKAQKPGRDNRRNVAIKSSLSRLIAILEPLRCKGVSRQI